MSKRVLRQKTAQQSVHWTLGILRTFQAVFYAFSFFRLDGVPPPTPAPVTQTVRRPATLIISSAKSGRNKLISSLVTLGVAVVAIVIYLLFIRPWQHRWGATDEEVARPMPGDAFVQHPTINATRAVTINARPEDIWPWIVQIGFGRAGWYSYDWIDNLGKPSVRRIVPEWQQMKIGDKIYLSKWTYEVVKQIDPYRGMLWVGGDSAATAGTWAWGLYPIDDEKTRLVTRLRGRYNWKSAWIVLLLVADTLDIVMMRRCMLGIKERVESPTFASRERFVL